MVAVATALLISGAWGALAAPLGRWLGYLDFPDEKPALKVHRRPVSLLGGVGIFLGAHGGLAWAGLDDFSLLAATSLLLVVGLIDDRMGLAPFTRLIAQGLAGVILVLGTGSPDQELSPLFVLFGVGLVLLAVNAVNLLDGLDGVAGSAGLITAAGLALLAAGRGSGSAYGWILVGSVAGFLAWNLPRARVFMGDSGAYVLGTFLAFGVLVASPAHSVEELAVAVSLLGVFLLDLAVTIVRRYRASRRLFTGDRDHLNDRLHQRGLSASGVVAVIAMVQTVMVGWVVATDRMPGPWAAFSLMVLIALALVSLAAAGLLRSESSERLNP